MGISTDGIICYGYHVGEVDEIEIFDPENEKEYDDGIYDWYIEKYLGYKEPFPMFDEKGMWLNNIEPPEHTITEYLDHRKKFKENNPPIPVELVNVCTSEYPSWIIAVPGTQQRCDRGYPQIITTETLAVDSIALEKFNEFINKNINPEIDLGELSWWLGSYYG